MAAKTTNQRRRRVLFSVQADKGSMVYVAGSFNAWDPMKNKLTDKKKNGIFTTSILLPQGSHEYKFVVNDVWCADPKCTEWVKNKHGTLNSVITVA